MSDIVSDIRKDFRFCYDASPKVKIGKQMRRLKPNLYLENLFNILISNVLCGLDWHWGSKSWRSQTFILPVLSCTQRLDVSKLITLHVMILWYIMYHGHDCMEFETQGNVSLRQSKSTLRWHWFSLRFHQLGNEQRILFH